MPAWTISHALRTPLLLLGVGELLISYSSLYVAALVVYGSIDECEQVIGPLAPRAWIMACAMLASLISMGLYNFHQRAYFREIFVRVAVGMLLASAVLAILFYAIPPINVSQDLAGIAAIYAFVLLLVYRFAFVCRVDKNIFRHQTLIYGAGTRAAAIAGLRRKADRRGFKIVGTVPAPGDNNTNDKDAPIDPIADKPVDELAAELGADEIVIAMDDRRGNLPVQQLLNAKLQGVKVIDLLEFLERETGKIRVDLVNPAWLIFSPGFRTGRIRMFMKRSLDLFASVIFLLVSLPFMLLIALAIKIEDGPFSNILYRQQRVGVNGHEFDVLKFRSMHEDAEADGKAVWAEKDDPRITRVGRILRILRLDELPQIFNVIRGQMSLVGPRPERPEFVLELSKKIPYYSERHTIKPGITGWAQLRYSYGATEEDAVEKLKYDLYYIKNHNILLDLMILLQTVEVILWGKGAR